MAGRHLLALAQRRHLVVQLEQALGSLAAGGLVGRDDHALDPGQIVQRLQRDDHLDRRAIGIGDDALGDCFEGVGVDLGDDQRHVGVHAPGAGIVDDDGTGLGGHGAELAADRRGRAGQDDVDAGECLGTDRLDGVFFALKLDGFARAAVGSQEFDGPERELVLDEHLPHDFADRTGRADYRNAWQHEWTLSNEGK